MQYGKVEICGVNTSQLKLLKESEKRELLNIIKNGSPAEKKKARDKMINGNLRLVLSVIQRFTNRGENPDDLFQVGVIGLIKAIDNFNPTLDVRFSTYGVPMIIGEIRRFLRDNNSVRVSRSMRDTAYRAMQIKEQLTNKNNREPTVEELAKELEMEVEKVEYVMKIKQDITSLDAGVGRDGDDGEDSTLGDFIEDEDTASPEDSASNQLLKEQVREVLSSLSDREQKIIKMRFGLDGTKSHTLEEVGLEFAVTRERIRQIEAKALRKLRHPARARYLQDYAAR